MPIFADTSQAQRAEIAGPDGNTVECFIIPVAVPVSEVAAELAAYDATNGTHPLAPQAKPIARAVLDALRVAWGAS
jgi:hypothetical protein